MRATLPVVVITLMAGLGCGGEVTEVAASSAAGAGGAASDAGAGGSNGEVDAGAPMDAGPPPDAPPGFFATLEGIWLIGWGGGMNHYSWVRFRMSDPNVGYGPADFLAGEDIVVNDPHWPCSGAGTWALAQKPDTVLIVLPEGCGASAEVIYTFVALMPAGEYPKGATLAGAVEENPPGASYEAYKFAPSQCDAAMTMCADPFL